MGLLKRVFCLIYSMISTAFLERNLFLYLGFNIQLVSFYMLAEFNLQMHQNSD